MVCRVVEHGCAVTYTEPGVYIVRVFSKPRKSNIRVSIHYVVQPSLRSQNGSPVHKSTPPPANIRVDFSQLTPAPAKPPELNSHPSPPRRRTPKPTEAILASSLRGGYNYTWVGPVANVSSSALKSKPPPDAVAQCFSKGAGQNTWQAVYT